MPKAKPEAELAVTAKADAVVLAKVEKLCVGGAAGLTGVEAGVAVMGPAAASGGSAEAEAASGASSFLSRADCCLAGDSSCAPEPAAGISVGLLSACYPGVD